MGLQTQCRVRVGRRVGVGKARLEGDALVFEGSFRLAIPFSTVRGAVVDEGALVVKTAEQEARFELGAVKAERWLRAVLEPKGLLERLGILPGSRVAVVDVYDGAFLGALRERGALLSEGRVPEGASVIVLGAPSREALRKIPILRTRLHPDGALWVVRPKGSKAISETDVLTAIREAWLTDTKVAAFSRTHTAHRAVIPAELRGRGLPRRPIVSLPPPAPAGAGPASKTTPPGGRLRSAKKA